MSRAHIRDPIAHGFVDRLLQGSLTSRDRHDLRAEEFHACNVERLTFHVDLTHVDYAFAAEACRHRGGGDAMLSRASFGDDAALAHSPSEQNLTERVVNLMCAGMQQILAFQVNLRATEISR